MKTTKTRARKNTVGEQVKAANHKTPEQPTGITLTNDELVIWNQSVRARQEWIEFELILLAKIVKIESQLREWWKLLKDSPLIEDTIPIVKLINTTQQTQLSIITKLHLMNRGDARTRNKPVKTEKTEKTSRVLTLLA